MSRIVIDANVFISSFYGGKPARVVARWKEGDATLCLSQPIIDECARIFRRLNLHDRLTELLDLFAQGFHSVFTAKTPALRVVSDPHDDKFIECAVALKADYIVSGDKALLAVKK